MLATLSASVELLMKNMSYDIGLITRAICSRASSTAFSASQPNPWLRLAALQKVFVKYESIASRTRGSTGVVEWLSKYTAYVVDMLAPRIPDKPDLVGRI